MLAYQIKHVPDSYSFERTELKRPDPGPGEVVLKVKAVSLNYRDLLEARGSYSATSGSFGIVPTSDGAGEVIEVGKGVERFKIGDRVVAAFMPAWLDGHLTKEKQASALGGGQVNGMLAEEVVLPASALLPVPSHLSYEEAATLPCAGVTAWYALFEGARVIPGTKVLLLGTGGVSIFALQFAKLAGAKVIITSSSEEKLKRAHELGADEIINYRAFPKWHEQVLKLTDGEGVDHIVEVGGAATINQSLESLRYGGYMSLVGVLTGQSGRVNTVGALVKNIRIQGTYVGSVAMFKRMNAAITHHRMQPVIDKVFSFKCAPDAFKHLESASHFGKIVITLS
jgi:NADPH:quinone reductase-like Zn-dependent oxidoreductase